MFFERPEGGEKAVLVHVAFSDNEQTEDPAEFVELVGSAGAERVALLHAHRAVPDPRYLIGSGKLDEVAAAVAEHGAELAIFNHTLSPSQERNLERALRCRVLDRTGLILDIFAQRARTHEGKLQVELAQLEHMSTRLVRGWSHLERQKGGIGLRGPGETQLETDRRLLRARIRSINKRLGKVRSHRAQGRRARRRAELPSVSLVGYTNAGKSTLFNTATAAGVFAADQLFATLDPTMRRLDVPQFGPVVLADTVGFIRHLPHRLVESFHATLEEAASADLLVHVIDAASDERERNVEQVERVLAEIGAADLPRLAVFNKIDLLGQTPRIDRNADGVAGRVWLSARTGDGLDGLFEAIGERLGDGFVQRRVAIAPAEGRLRAQLYARGAVLGEAVEDDGSLRLDVRLPRLEFERLFGAAAPVA